MIFCLSVSKNQNWEYILKWKLECFPIFWASMSFMCLSSARLGKRSCSAASVLVQPSIQLCLQLPGQHMAEEGEDLLGKQIVRSPTIQGKRLQTWNLLVDSSERRACGRTCRGGSWLWSARGLFGQGQQRRPKENVRLGEFLGNREAGQVYRWKRWLAIDLIG